MTDLVHIYTAKDKYVAETVKGFLENNDIKAMRQKIGTGTFLGINRKTIITTSQTPK